MAGPIRGTILLCFVFFVAARVERGNKFFQPDARHQLHAEQALIRRSIDGFGKHLHDVLMLKSSHRAAFAAAIGRHLERYQAIERRLSREVHVAECAAA